jgi:uncharacterized protein YraI
MTEAGVSRIPLTAIGAILGLAAWSVAGATPARAADGAIAWPTFFRLGPGAQYRAVGELARGVVLDIQDCGEGWCRARLGATVGYVRQAALEPGEFAASKPASGQDCFSSRRAGYGTGEAFRYCPRWASPRRAADG